LGKFDFSKGEGPHPFSWANLNSKKRLYLHSGLDAYAFLYLLLVL